MVNIDVNHDKLNVGILTVSVAKLPVGTRARVHIYKVGYPEYHYTVRNNGTFDYPLSCGNGEYSVTTYRENMPDTSRYIAYGKDNVTINLTNSNIVFLQPNVNVFWTENMECFKFAKMQINSLDSHHTAITKFWKYMINNYSYDWDMADNSNLKYNYTPDLNRIYESKSDICFGLTSLLCAFLRINNIPAQMVHGYAKGVIPYHAWTKVWLNGKWEKIDMTVDMAMRLTERQHRDGIGDTIKFVY